jgi:GNAT superfamily N-acetyltransferase
VRGASVCGMPRDASVDIRQANADDGLAVAEIYLASFKATYKFSLAHTDEDVRSWIAASLLPTSETWVAEQGGRVVGFVSMGDETVEQLYVAPGHTGQGIGSRLLTLAQQRRPRGLALWTFQTNGRARRFYERHGFRAAELTDGHGNEEQQPDVRYVWSRSE